MSTQESEVVADIGSDYERKYGFHDAENYFFKSQRGLTPEVVEAISAHKSEPDWMRKFRLKSLEYLPGQADARVGRRSLGDRLRQHLLLHPAHREAGELVGRHAGRHQADLGPARYSRGREEVPGRRRRPVRVRGRVPQAPGGALEEGRPLPGHGLGAARARGPRQAVLRHHHPAERQQVRRAQLGGVVGRLVHLRAARACRSRSRCRPTSASTRRTWASSSGR